MVDRRGAWREALESELGRPFIPEEDIVGHCSKCRRPLRLPRVRVADWRGDPSAAQRGQLSPLLCNGCYKPLSPQLPGSRKRRKDAGVRRGSAPEEVVERANERVESAVFDPFSHMSREQKCVLVSARLRCTVAETREIAAMLSLIPQPDANEAGALGARIALRDLHI